MCYYNTTMNKTEERAYYWLLSQGYTGIVFQRQDSPDFLVDGDVGFEVKKSRHNTIVFAETQWTKLEKHPKVKVLIFNDSTEPLAIVDFSELSLPPSYWKQFRLLLFRHHRARKGDYHLDIQGNTWLSVKKVSEILLVHENTVYKWLETGQLKGSKIGGKLWRISRDDLDDFAGAVRGAKK